jgi:hypothetical protein
MKMALRQCETNLIRRRIFFSIRTYVNISYRERFSAAKRETRPQICLLPEIWMFSTISSTKVDSLHETNPIFGISLEICVEPNMFPCVYVTCFFSENFIFWLYKKSRKVFPSHSVRSHSRQRELNTLILKNIFFSSIGQSMGRCWAT